jgi:hypothetical protein
MNSAVLSFGRKFISHEAFEDFVFSLPLVTGWATIWAAISGFDSFLPTFLLTSFSVVGIRFLLMFLTQWFKVAKSVQMDLVSSFDRMIEENNQIKILMAEAEKETLKEKTLKSITPKSIPPKSKETVVIQTKKMTLRNPNAGRPGRKPRTVTTNNQKET